MFNIGHKYATKKKVHVWMGEGKKTKNTVFSIQSLSPTNIRKFTAPRQNWCAMPSPSSRFMLCRLFFGIESEWVSALVRQREFGP